MERRKFTTRRSPSGINWKHQKELREQTNRAIERVERSVARNREQLDRAKAKK